MRKLGRYVAAALVCGACFMVGQVVAQEGGGGFQMPAWTQKKEQHAALAKFVGDWDVKQKMWMMPGSPPMESPGKGTGKALFDGRFVEQSYAGEIMGNPFNGRLTLAFDNVDKEYVAIWIDNTSTYMSVSRGNEKDGVVSFDQNDPDWMTGKKTKSRMDVQWTNENEYTISMVRPGPDGKDMPTMHFTYTRKGAAAPETPKDK